MGTRNLPPKAWMLGSQQDPLLPHLPQQVSQSPVAWFLARLSPGHPSPAPPADYPSPRLYHASCASPTPPAPLPRLLRLSHDPCLRFYMSSASPNVRPWHMKCIKVLRLLVDALPGFKNQAKSCHTWSTSGCEADSRTDGRT
ncbi:hypothetical protein Hamer_G022644 [Homarus americanus]|uniref:Uncharacterized protein n=1 Tax=Homarus americanus TaxID=6706 RepID=A0A8J5K1E0_HOMAM|nr:hypothetical protein Hamer_G022644 [Homarus americanus]